MAYTCDRPGFNVSVDGAVLNDGRWLVSGVMRLRPQTSATARAEVESEAVLELILGIIREALRGRELGARSLDVVIDGDHGVSGLSLRFDRYRAA